MSLIEASYLYQRQLLATAREVRAFAERAARGSNLPGGQFGPRDAFRHIVGAAELARRVGVRPAD